MGGALVFMVQVLGPLLQGSGLQIQSVSTGLFLLNPAFSFGMLLVVWGRTFLLLNGLRAIRVLPLTSTQIASMILNNQGALIAGFIASLALYDVLIVRDHSHLLNLTSVGSTDWGISSFLTALWMRFDDRKRVSAVLIMSPILLGVLQMYVSINRLSLTPWFLTIVMLIPIAWFLIENAVRKSHGAYRCNMALFGALNSRR